MSNETPDKDLNLDLHFLPSWAQESPEINRYANYEGDRGKRRFDRDQRGPGRSGGGRGGDRPRGNRPDGGQFGGNRPGGNRPGGGDRGPQRGGGHGQGQRQDRRHGGKPQFERRQEVPMPDVNLRILPEDRGVDSLAKQIRMTGRAYPLFDIARLVLQKDDRYQIEFSTRKNPEGNVAQPLFACALDDSLWLREEDAVGHILDRHLATFYEVRKTPTDPPKGTYSFVAQCGMSGAILGPPNYHDYQNKLHQLHKERFSRMPFENFKSRVKIVRDEEVVKKWIDEQSFKTEFVVLNVPEPLVLGSFDEVEKHFRETHLAEMVKSVDNHIVPGAKSRRIGSRELQRYVFSSVDEQKRFPLKLVTTLSQKFSTQGLHFFKVKKSIVHVAVARPHFLDIATTPVSDGVRKIVEYVNEHSRCSVKELVDVLAPASAEPNISPEPAKPEAPVVETPVAEGDVAPAKPATHHEPTEAQKRVLADLHWLVHQGHVIEFASGELETAKKPNPKPQPKKKAVAKPAKTEAATTVAPNEKTTTPTAAVEVDKTPEAAPNAEAASAVAEAESAPTPSVDSEAASAPPENTAAETKVANESSAVPVESPENVAAPVETKPSITTDPSQPAAEAEAKKGDDKV